ncbi:MAG TPA: serine/threonine-protein kinase [Candidatus Dormibacteraeota bacterium]|nr:serine/threonine-protein kinase [Candidatus Dormibacteraeota bacterium]
MSTDRDRERVAALLPAYDIGEELGRGSFGVVMRGEHRSLRRPVAVKQLTRSVSADAAVQQRFAAEARVLASLDHPHIVQIYDFVEQDDVCLLVMELLPGGTLRERIGSTGISAQAACSLALAACTGLHYAHGHGVLHRDVKPDNLMFTAAGVLRVTDFGIAKVFGGSASLQTATGVVIGTPVYMAPEQASGTQLTTATDVYALGTVLYELLAGRLPFPDDDNPLTILYRHVHEQPLDLREAAPSVPPPVAAAVMDALSTDPGGRPPDAEELGVALARAATAAWGPAWVGQSGQQVVASGRIAAVMSSPPGTSVAADLGVTAHGSGGPGRGAVSLPRPSASGGPAPSGPPPGGWRSPAPPPDASGPVGGPPVGARPATGGRRRPWLVVAAVAVVVAAAAAVVVALTRGGGTPVVERTPPPSQSFGPSASASGTPNRNAGAVVYNVALTRGAPGWEADAGQDGNGMGTPNSDGYVITVLKPLPALSFFSVGSPYAARLQALDVDVTVALLTAAPQDGAGVRCDQGGRAGLRYAFEVHPDGSWMVVRVDDVNGPKLLRQGAGVVTTGPFRLQASCLEVAGGTELRLTVDSVRVADVMDTHPGGAIGWHTALTASRDAKSPGMQARFSDFAIVDLTGG